MLEPIAPAWPVPWFKDHGEYTAYKARFAQEMASGLRAAEERLFALVQDACATNHGIEIAAELFDHGAQVGVGVRKAGRAHAVRRPVQGFGSAELLACIMECAEEIERKLNGQA